MTDNTVEITKAEQIKRDSLGLRGKIGAEIEADDLKKFSNESEQLLKFHGMYQQKDRDRRKPEDKHLGPKPFGLMIRGRIPGGRGHFLSGHQCHRGLPRFCGGWYGNGPQQA